MKKLLTYMIVFTLFASVSFADDLYKVNVNSQLDADILNELDAKPVLTLHRGYIVLLPEKSSEKLPSTTLNFELLQNNINFDQLYIQSLRGMPVSFKENVLYTDGEIQLILESKNYLSTSEILQNIYPVPERKNIIQFFPLSSSNQFETNAIGGLDTLIDKISQDSLESYLHRLEAFNGRLTGTDSSYASRDWISDKFREFGYDSVVFDPFTGRQLWSRARVESYNIIAYKIGSVSPEQQIIIGAHYDAVPGSPGSDDNGTGTAAVLEIARILKDIETDKTFIFIAFDSEESGLHGAYHYADLARERNDDIVVMLNADMIANVGNNFEANLFTGGEKGYAHLWNDLSGPLVNISGFISGSSSSDHYPFQTNGYDVVFVHERIFSSVYHSFQDSTSYVDFDYMTRMVKGTLATAYTVSQLPSVVKDLYIAQPGDGTSLLASWSQVTSPNVSHLLFYYHKTSEPSIIDSIQLSSTVNEINIQNLEDGIEYSFYVKAFDFNGNTSVVYDIITATPQSIPLPPENMTALPNINMIELVWAKNNSELDFDHYNLYRDSAFLIEVFDTSYIDNSPSLGIDLHEYFVVAVDTDGNQSPPELSERVISRTAVLEPNRILALNRSTFMPNQMVDEVETGKFMREALDAFNFDYFSDTAYLRLDPEKYFQLNDMLDYGIVIIGAESGGSDDITSSHQYANMSEIISYYLSIGGKVIIFGRWAMSYESVATTYYNFNSPTYLQMYSDYFNISSRVSNATTGDFTPQGIIISAELIGAKSQQSGYPELTWDSLLTDQHNDDFFYSNGIPIANYVTFNSSDVEVIYSFKSNIPGSQFEDKPIAWKNTVGPNKYVYYDIPLSFFERTQAITALRTSVLDMMQIPTDTNDRDDIAVLPKTFQLNQNYPNPFNPSTTIEFSLPEKDKIAILVYNILGQTIKTLTDETYPAGTHKVKWDGTNTDGEKVSSGIYLYKIVGSEFSDSKKMILLK